VRNEHLTTPHDIFDIEALRTTFNFSSCYMRETSPVPYRNK